MWLTWSQRNQNSYNLYLCITDTSRLRTGHVVLDQKSQNSYELSLFNTDVRILQTVHLALKKSEFIQRNFHMFTPLYYEEFTQPY